MPHITDINSSKSKAKRLREKAKVIFTPKEARNLDVLEVCSKLGIKKQEFLSAFRSLRAFKKFIGVEEETYYLSEEKIFEEAVKLSRKLGRLPTFKEFYSETRIETCSITPRFGSWSNLISLVSRSYGFKRTKNEDFTKIVESVFKGKTIIQEFEISANGKIYRIDYVIKEDNIAIELDGSSHFTPEIWGLDPEEKFKSDSIKEQAIRKLFILYRFKYSWPWKEEVLMETIGGSTKYEQYSLIREKAILESEFTKPTKRRLALKEAISKGLEYRHCLYLRDYSYLNQDSISNVLKKDVEYLFGKEFLSTFVDKGPMDDFLRLERRKVLQALLISNKMSPEEILEAKEYTKLLPSTALKGSIKRSLKTDLISVLTKQEFEENWSYFFEDLR